MIEQDIVYLHFESDQMVADPKVLKPPRPIMLAVGPNPAYQKSLTFNRVWANRRIACSVCFL
jgi:hypothetical protein